MEHREIPTDATSGHYYNAPGYYGVAAVIDRLGERHGYSEPQTRRLVQLF